MDLQAAGAAGSFAAGRKTSVAGSILGVATGQGGRRLFPDFEFSLGAAKVKVLKALEETLPAPFVRFYNSPLFDRLLHSLVLYFCAVFQHELLSHVAERSRPAHAEGCSSQLLSGRLIELREEVEARRRELSQPYCEIILKHSSYKNQQQDKRFFESLYASLTAVLAEAFERLGRQAALEQELGRLFRGKHFNLAARHHGPQRSVDSMTVMQMWEVKNQTANRALHSRLINSLYEKAPTLSVQIAAVSNTPLVSQAVSSPMVARSLLADPAERGALQGLTHNNRPHRSKGARGTRPGAQLPLGLAALVTPGMKRDESMATGVLPGSSPRVAAAAAPAAGGGPALLASSSMSIAAAASPGPTAAAAAGTSAATPGQRASTVRPFQGVVASLPEAAGLPYDENFAYLCLLQRSVRYGPTLGLPTAPPVGASRAGMVSMMGFAAPSGSLSHSSSVVFRV